MTMPMLNLIAKNASEISQEVSVEAVTLSDVFYLYTQDGNWVYILVGFMVIVIPLSVGYLVEHIIKKES